jgi:hypothetical protein
LLIKLGSIIVFLGFVGCPFISTFSIVVPHRVTLPSFIAFTPLLNVNLIPPASIPVIPLKAPSLIQLTPSAEIVFKLVAPLKALALIDVTVVGKVIEVIVI